MTEQQAPERIWIAGHLGEYGPYYPEAVEAEREHGGHAVEYVRADLAPQPEADPVREARPPDVVVGADSTKLIAGFMFDCNAVGVEGAAQNLVKSIKERCAAYRARAGGS
tara:strand:- start:5419 stop:5748 length:330 start_codon:yes stop_codon:yes gene_type:complete